MGVIDQSRIILKSSLDLIYPNDCNICGVNLTVNENHVCLSCMYDLPYITTNQNEVTKLSKLFWGRVEVEYVYSLFNYHKGNQVQKLLHQIKYKGKSKLGEYFGGVLGSTINGLNKPSVIIPIPLHNKRLQQRGYNQSTIISKGIKKELQIPIDEKIVVRVSHNKSQTLFSKYDRYENVRSIFRVVKPERLVNKHILLVDDVLTTGATIEACVNQLLKVPGCTVSVATLAARI